MTTDDGGVEEAGERDEEWENDLEDMRTIFSVSDMLKTGFPIDDGG